MSNLILWANRTGNIDDFYRIFGISFPNDLVIEEAINDFSLAYHKYADFTELLAQNKQMEKRYRSFELNSSDVFGYAVTSIKLAGEGYTGESLSILRSAIDIFITSLFTSLSWIPSSDEEEINPFAEALESPYYHRMKEISLDDILTNRIYSGEEGKGEPLKIKINDISTRCLEDYLKEMNVDKERIKSGDQTRYQGELSRALDHISIELFKNSKQFHEMKTEITSPKSLLGALMNDERFVFRACKAHEEKLLDRLKKRLEISGEMADEMKDELKKLTFIFPIERNGEDNLPFCDDCEELPEIWSINVRFDKNSMIKYIKQHLAKEPQTKINKCLKSSLERKENVFFGDLINYKIYRELNPYSHGDPKEEPTIEEWYGLYVKPFLKSLSCVYGGIIS